MNALLENIEERVVAAYKAHDMRAINASVSGVVNGQACGCAVGALARGKVKGLLSTDSALAALGWSSYEGWRFVSAFDRTLNPADYTEPYGGVKGEWYEAGERTAIAVINAGLKL